MQFAGSFLFIEREIYNVYYGEKHNYNLLKLWRYYYDHDRNVKMCEDIEDKVVVIDNEYVHIADVWYDNGINAYRITFEVIDDAYRENGHVGGKFVAFGSYNLYTRNQLMKQYNEFKELDNVI